MKFRLKTIALAWMILLFLCSVTTAQSTARTEERDRQALIALENDWLAHQHDAAKLEGILASDFVHPVPTGDFASKSQHIQYASSHPLPEGLKNRFDSLKIRVYGDVGIATGIVITTDASGKDISKTLFTDVFVYREGRWQAVNAQENQVRQ